MIWMDYTVEQAGDNFTVKGDWPGEVMGNQKDGSAKAHWIYKPGDVFIVKTDQVGTLMKKYEAGLNGHSTSD